MFNAKGEGRSNKPYFINSGVIEKAVDIHDPEALSTPKEGEVGVVLHVKQDGGRDQTLFVTGMPKGDANPKYPWAGAFHVLNLLQQVDNWEVSEDKISAETLAKLAGKEVYWIRYETTESTPTDRKYRNYREVGPTVSSVERKFLKDVESNQVYQFIGLQSEVTP